MKSTFGDVNISASFTALKQLFSQLSKTDPPTESWFQASNRKLDSLAFLIGKNVDQANSVKQQPSLHSSTKLMWNLNEWVLESPILEQSLNPSFWVFISYELFELWRSFFLKLERLLLLYREQFVSYNKESSRNWEILAQKLAHIKSYYASCGEDIASSL